MLSAAVAGAGSLSACGSAENEAIAPTKPDGVTPAAIANAESLQGVEFTDAERALMLENIEDRLERLKALRAIAMPNSRNISTI